MKAVDGFRPVFFNFRKDSQYDQTITCHFRNCSWEYEMPHGLIRISGPAHHYVGISLSVGKIRGCTATERGKHDYLLGAIPVIIRILGTGLSGSPEYGVGGASSLAKFNV